MYLRQNSLVPTIHFGSCKHLHFCLLTGGNSKEVKPLTDQPAIKSVVSGLQNFSTCNFNLLNQVKFDMEF